MSDAMSIIPATNFVLSCLEPLVSVMRLTVRTALALLLVVMSVDASAADEKGELSPANESKLKQIRALLDTLQPRLLRDKRELEAKLHGKPSLLYADNSRDLTNSSLWVWEDAGRPVGVTAIEWHAAGENEGRWTFEFASLCADKVRITLPSGNWTTTDTAHLAPIADAPAVAETRPQRQQQMKKLAERFAGTEQHPAEGRVELRRLTAPVYTESAAGESAIFVFANGTNPEIALLIKIIREGEQDQRWGFVAAALSSTELNLSFDDRNVWKEVRFTRPRTRGTYTNGALPSSTTSDSNLPK